MRSTVTWLLVFFCSLVYSYILILQDSILSDQPIESVASSSRNDCLPPGPSEQAANVKESRYVKIRRVMVIKDLLEIFMDCKVLNLALRMEFANEKALDDDGVSRDVYTAFWEEFLEHCEGEDERVPRLRPDYSEREWQAIGRIWVKGYMDHGLIPVRLSPAFILACNHGVTAVDEELLMSSFMKYLSAGERSAVEKALLGNMDENDDEELLDLFSRMGSHHLPPKENMHAVIQIMAHKVILQESKFIIDCFSSSITSVQLNLPTKQSIVELYESKKPTNKKVACMIQTSKEFLNQQEQMAFNYLQRYVKNATPRKLETFLRFCTGSTVMCKDKIDLTFNALSGLSRRPVAHTCAAVLELPYTYNSYPEFRTEFDNVLSGDCFAMDIL